MNLKQLAIRIRRSIKRRMEIFDLSKIIGRKYIDEINKKEYFNPPFSTFNERPVEYKFVFEQIAQFYPERILDVGTGVTALPHLMSNCGCKVTAIDNIKDYWRKDAFNRHYYVIDDDITKPKINDIFDLITCISTLEHIENYDQAVKNMFALLKSGGLLILTFPYNEKTFADNVYILHGSSVGRELPFKTHSYSKKEIENWAKENGAKIIKQEYWQFYTGNFWTVGQNLAIPKQVTKEDKHQLSCILFQKT